MSITLKCLDIPGAGDSMNTARLVRLIKKANRKDRRMPSTVKSIPNRNRWSTAVRSWIVEFKDRDRTESTPAFDSLFNDASPPSDPETESSSD